MTTQAPDVTGRLRRVDRHYGPGQHPGTGTEQEVHAGDGVAVAEAPPETGGLRSQDWRAVSDGFSQTAERLSPFQMTKVNFTGFWLSPDGEIYRVQGMRHNESAESAIEAARGQLSASVLEYYQELKASRMTDSPALDVALELGFIRGWMSGGNAPKEISLTFDESATSLRRAQKQTLLDIFSVSPDREYSFVYAVYPTAGMHIPVESGRDRDEFMARFGLVKRNHVGIQRAVQGFSDALATLEGLLTRGGPGSGHHGHKGRPGKVGGSAPDTAGPSERPKESETGVESATGAMLSMTARQTKAANAFQRQRGTIEDFLALYGEMPPRAGYWNFDRDVWERKLADAAARAGLPVWNQYRYAEGILPEGREAVLDAATAHLNLYFKGMPEIPGIMATLADFVDEPIGDNQILRSSVDWGDPDRDPQLIDRLNEVEAEIAGLNHEVAYVLRPNGDIVFRKTGERTQVLFNDVELGLMEGSVMVHNHPSDSSFSDEDIQLAGNVGAVETIVVGRGGSRSIMRINHEAADKLAEDAGPYRGFSDLHGALAVLGSQADHDIRVILGPMVEGRELATVHASDYHTVEQWMRVERELNDVLDYVYWPKKK